MALDNLQTTIINILVGGEAVVTSLFTGGVWDRLPRAGTGERATPGAFYPATHPTQPGRLKNTISVLDGGDNPGPDGLARNGFVGFPLVYAWVSPDPAGETALNTLDTSLRARFRRGVSYPRTDGSGMELVVLERAPLKDAEEYGYPGRLFTTWRIQGTFVRPF
jgi:hypothetical protein